MRHLIQLIKQNKLVTFLLIIFAGIALWVIFNKTTNRGDEMVPITVRAIQTTEGWGYEILADGKVYIRQVNIPAIQGKKSFKSKEDALFVGNKAVRKMVEGKGKLPVITVEELKQWGIADKDEI